MGKIYDNNLTDGIRGKIGKVVFRKWYGGTIAAKSPEFTLPPSEAQVKARAFFKEASAYARAAAADPERRRAYFAKAKKHQTAYNVALKEFYQMHAGADGVPGEETLQAQKPEGYDDCGKAGFCVLPVKVTILEPVPVMYRSAKA